MAKRKQDWTPAKEFKTTKLAPNGPKPGQSYASWAAGKDQSDKHWDRQRSKNIHKLV